MMKFLVTGANGDIAEAVQKILIETFPNCIIHGTDSSGLWPGKFYFKKVFKIPHADSKKYLDYIKTVSKKYNLIIPTTEKEIIKLSKNRIDCDKILINSKKVCKIFFDKLETSKFLQDNNLSFLYTEKIKNFKKKKNKIFIKPRHGSGSKNLYLAKNFKEFKAFKKVLNNKWIAQEYLYANEEFTCAIFRSNLKYKELIMKRVLKDGITYYFETYKNKKISNILYKLANIIDLNGCINVQLKFFKGIPKIFEINPRLSSTILMRHKLGFQDLIMWINDKIKLNLKFKKMSNKSVRVYRLSNFGILRK